MKKTTTFLGALAFTLAFSVTPISLLQAQNRDRTEISVKDLPKISMTSPMGNFNANFNGLNIKRNDLGAALSEWLGTDTNHTFKLLKSDTDELGITHTSYQHYYKGVRVQDDLVLLHDKNGIVTYANGELIKNINISPAGAVSVNELENLIKKDLGAESVTLSGIEPVIAKVLKEKNVEVYSSTKVEALSMKPLKAFNYIVDNISHTVINKLSKMYEADTPSTSTTYYRGNQQITVDTYNGQYRLLDNARNIHTYDATNLTGQYNTSTGDLTGAVEYLNAAANFTAVNTKPAVEVHWAMSKSHDYYKNIHNRNSFDGNGSLVKNYYNVDFNKFDTSVPPGFGFNAAALDQGVITCMVYGNGAYKAYDAQGNVQSANIAGPFVALDVAGHEFSHLIVSRNGTGGLNYQSESGALNESFADIFGAAIEFYSVSNANWTVGEGILTNPNIGTFLRSLSNPNSGPSVLGSQQPDTYQGTYWASTANPTAQNDHGGVHTNSGVGNYWFYLLSAGGSGTNDIGNAFNVTSLTIQKAEKIAYRTLTNYLTPNATYLDAYNGSKQAVTDLYGASGNEAQQNVNAWYAVGIGTGTLSTAETAGKLENKLTIYPNPVKTNVFTIENEQSNATFEIYDISGKLIRKNEKLNKGINKINITGAQKGIYIVKVSSEGNTVSKKIVVE